MDAELVEYELERAHIPFEARRVDTRESFLHQLGTFLPDVILSDFTLPGFDGMSALSLARERAPAVPFLIVTGSVNEETAVGCMKAGATDYLLKSHLARIGPAIQGALATVRARTVARSSVTLSPPISSKKFLPSATTLRATLRQIDEISRSRLRTPASRV